VTAAYYTGLASLSVWALRRANWAPRGRRPSAGRELTFGVSVGAVILSGSLLPLNGSPTRLVWLGTGEGMLLQSGGRTALIDGSPRPLQLLDALGAELGIQRSIDVVVVTDPRSNVAGLLDVLRHYSVREVLDVGCEYPSLTYARWRAALRARGIPVYALRTGTSFRVGEVVLRTLGPDAVYPNPTDSIGLLRLRFPTQSVLLAGASSSRERTEAVFRPVHLKAGLAVVDAGTRSPAAFVRHVGAHRVIRLPAASSPVQRSPRPLVVDRG
jgi:beta-lactamase superfamily II metal-dependent hydrolase